MAVLKLNYTRAGGAAKANVRYIESRPGKDKAKTMRTLWNSDGKVTREEAYQMIDTAEKGSIFFRIKICPDAKTEDTKRDISLQKVTEETMAALQDHIQKPIQYVAVMHDDHTPLRHVHVLAIVKGGIYNKEREAMHQAATREALYQRKQRDLMQEQRPEQERKGEQWQREQSR